jgi:hypothetical protein
MTDPISSTAPRRVRGPDDLLALVPTLFGFHPAESLVLLTVGDSATPFHARVDLPTDPCGIEVVGAQLTTTAQRNGSTEVVAVVYTGDAGLAHAVVEHLFDCLAEIGVELVCAVRSDGDRWWVLPSWPDDEGTPYDVRDHPWTAEEVLEGNVVHASREELAMTLIGNDPEEAEQITALAKEITERLDRSPTRGLVLEAHWVRSRVRRFLRDRRPLDTDDVARLAAVTHRSVHVRDVAWAEMNHANASVHVDLWREAARRAPMELRAPVATLMAFAAWLSGDGALAWCGVERALDADPGYGLASLLTKMLAGAMPPSSWQPLSSKELML